MKKFKVKLQGSVVKEVEADSLADFRNKIADVHSLELDKIRFIKPMIKVLPVLL